MPATCDTDPLLIRTARLTIAPFEDGDAARFAAIAGDLGVARMMSSIPHPFTAADAEAWIDGRRWKGRIGFCAAIRDQRDLVGMVGIGGDPVDTAYLIGRAHWGRGFATEAMRGFLAEMFARFPLTRVTAGAFDDNPASVRVLEKLGFTYDRSYMNPSKARAEPGRVREYAIDRAAVEARGGPQL